MGWLLPSQDVETRAREAGPAPPRGCRLPREGRVDLPVAGSVRAAGHHSLKQMRSLLGGSHDTLRRRR